MKGIGSFLQIIRRQIMAIITASEVARRYHSIIESYLNKGYNLSLFTLNGSFSGVLKYTDLISDKDKSKLIRVWVKREILHSCDILGNATDDLQIYLEAVSITIKKYNRRADDSYYWFSDGETISKTMFYTIKDKACYTDTFEDFTAYWKKHNSRIGNKEYLLKGLTTRKVSPSKLPNKFIDSIMRKINAIRGFRQATSACIQDVVIGRSSVPYSRGKMRLTALVNVCYKGRSEHLRLT